MTTPISCSPPLDAAPSRLAMQEAAQWYALLRSGEATERDRQRWRQWHGSTADRRRAWNLVEQIDQGLRPLKSSPDPQRTSASLLVAAARVKSRRRVLKSLLLAGGAGALGWGAQRYTDLPETLLAFGADYRTATGEILRVALPDTGTLWLNTASAVIVDYTPALRRIEVLRGEALVETAQDASMRPFVMDTRDGRMQALGTRFSARLLKSATHMAVYDGAVRVQPARWEGGGEVVRAGRQVRFDDRNVTRLGAVLPGEQAWTSGMLQAQDIALRDLAAELNRYTRSHISVADEVADLRVVGSFPLRDIGQALAALEPALPVRVQRPLPWWIKIGPR